MGAAWARCYSRVVVRADVIEPDLALVGGRFERGIRVEILPEGTLGRVGRFEHPAVRRLPGRAVIPGFVNAHSHAFQRGLRGMGEDFPVGAGSFFTWREAMYALVERLDFGSAYTLSRKAFEEMLDAGFTTVGEFHYVRHISDQARFVLDEAIVTAAADAGIRLVLLHTAYETGGVERPLVGGQRRFETRGLDEYWREHARLEELVGGIGGTVGVVAHSVRAVPFNSIRLLHQGSLERGQVFHMHVEEVVLEITECEGHYGRRPMQMVVEELAVDGRFTAVHCTHTDPRDMERFGARGGNVCLCPLTEGNLGDGVPGVPHMRKAGARIAIGTDLNSRLCAFEELRWLEYVQRVTRQERGVLVNSHGHAAEALLEVGTVNGARSLGVHAGLLEPGRLADLAVIDLEHPTLAEWTERSLPASLVFGAGTSVVVATCVGGRWRHRRGAPSCAPPAS